MAYKYEKLQRIGMTPQELESFLEEQDLSNKEFAEILGVTKSAVDHWIEGIRRIPNLVIKIIHLFKKYPQLMKEI